jgi:hypothetical protein
MSNLVRGFVVASLVTALNASVGYAALITVNAFNDGDQATITANDGVNSDSFQTLLTQFNVTLTPDSGPATSFQTFCVDLFHSISLGQNYAVTVRSDLATAFANGSRIAEIYESFGTSDLSSNPTQAAAVQLAVWDLSLSNHTPTSFVDDGGGVYSSGDPSVFSADISADSDAAAIATLVNTYLQGSVGANISGTWLDASAAGDAFDRGQSLLIPPSLGVPFLPEPTSLTMLAIGSAGLLIRRRRA